MQTQSFKKSNQTKNQIENTTKPPLFQDNTKANGKQSLSVKLNLSDIPYLKVSDL